MAGAGSLLSRADWPAIALLAVLLTAPARADDAAPLESADFVLLAPGTWRGVDCDFPKERCFETENGDRVVIAINELPALVTAEKEVDSADDSKGAANDEANAIVRLRPADPTRDFKLEVAERSSSRSLGSDRALSTMAWRMTRGGEIRTTLQGSIWARRSLTQVSIGGRSDLAQLHADLDALLAAIAWR